MEDFGLIFSTKVNKETGKKNEGVLALIL